MSQKFSKQETQKNGAIQGTMALPHLLTDKNRHMSQKFSK